NVLNSEEGKEISGIKIHKDKTVLQVKLAISPLFVKGERKMLLVTFSEDKSVIDFNQENVFDEDVYLSKYILNIEEEVKELKDKLNSSHEKLHASNENMQSFNEEL